MEQLQFLDSIEAIISEKISEFENTEIDIIAQDDIPLGDFKMNTWFKISDVICVFVDIRGSTKLSATAHDKSTASIYELFTGTAVKIFHEFNASYIDVKGDGVFALFNKNEIFLATAAAISFKTFVFEKFIPLMKRKTPNLDIGVHMGIDQKTVLVKQVGLKDNPNRDSRKNEVWAGKPINMAAKLASRSRDDELWVSERFFNNLNDEELVIKSCGCSDNQESITGIKTDLWQEIDVSNDGNFDFDKAFILKSVWCKNHGKEWCENIINLDNK